jgi:hypothetical protein
MTIAAAPHNRVQSFFFRALLADGGVGGNQSRQRRHNFVGMPRKSATISVGEGKLGTHLQRGIKYHTINNGYDNIRNQSANASIEKE